MSNRYYEMPFDGDRMSLYNLIFFYLSNNHKYARLSDCLKHVYAEAILKDIEEEFK